MLEEALWLEEAEKEQSRRRRGQGRGWARTRGPGHVGLVCHFKDFVFYFERDETL